MKILAAHNTLTGNKPLHWYDYITNLFSRCQCNNVIDLYNKGVRLFDLRVRINSANKAAIAHGLTQYKGDIIDILAKLKAVSKGEDIYIRLVNEDTFLKSNTEEFIKLSKSIQVIFPKFKYQIVGSKKTWPVIINQFPNIINNEMFWVNGVNFLFPYFYAKKYKSRNMDRFVNSTEDGIWWFDFI